jgi:uncharacterized membrane protein YphA (DoxX/SURF4 family)
VSPIRSLARPLLAATYVVDGASGLKSPAERVAAARAAGLSDPEKLVQVSAATQLLGGLALATGRLPRLSALSLAAVMVPSTYVRHPFWSSGEAKGEQRTLFLKNLSMVGGLLLAAADTGGRESIPHAAGRVSRRARKKAARAAQRAEKRLHS